MQHSINSAYTKRTTCLNHFKMGNFMKNIIIFALIMIIQDKFQFVICFSFQSKTIKISSFSECPQDDDTLIHFNGTIAKEARNQYAINGEFTIAENITSPIEVILLFS